MLKKVFSVVATLALVASVSVPAASALSVSAIEALLVGAGVDATVAATLAAAIGDAEVTTTSSNACALKTAPDMTVGSQGSNVVALQELLVASGDLVMPAGVSMGYFGGLTQAALASWQASMGVSPASGYFGPITRSTISCVTTETDDDDRDDRDGGTLRGGEASLEDFDISSGDDDEIEEGMSGEVAEIEFDVEDADVELQRMDLALVATGSSQEEDDPWDTFESLSLLVDGDVIAEVDLDDEDEYLDEDNGEVRISNIDYVFEEDETATIVVEITTQNSVDGADVSEGAEWTINVLEDGIRALDAEGIDQYIGDIDTVTFDIVEEGDGEELNLSSSSDDPEATTLAVDEDNKSDEYTIFMFEVEAEDNDVELDYVSINVDTATADVEDVVNDFVLEIDGESFDDWDYTDADDGATTTATIRFDIDGDYTIDEDEEPTFALMAEFNSANGSNFATSGETIAADVATGAVEGEGADDITSTGTASGETHALEIAGIIVDESGFDDVNFTKSNDEGTIGVFEFSFEVTAFEEDFYIATSSVTTFLNGPGAASTSVSVSSSAEEDTTDVFTIDKDSTETITVTVTVSSASVAGQYRVGLDSVDYTENSDGVTDTTTKDVENSDFRTGYEQIN